MEIEEFVLNSPQRLGDFKAWLVGHSTIDIKYSCCCDAMGKKVTTCALVMYREKSAYERGVTEWRQKRDRKNQ